MPYKDPEKAKAYAREWVNKKNAGRRGELGIIERERRARHKALGLCRLCAEPAREGRSLCERHAIIQKARQRRHDYGLTREQLAELESRPACEICGGPPEAVDHCHATGRIRGMLCRRCNRILGHAKDDASVLIRAAEYLNRHVLPEKDTPP